jgi:hypothetical protein
MTLTAGAIVSAKWTCVSQREDYEDFLRRHVVLFCRGNGDLTLQCAMDADSCREPVHASGAGLCTGVVGQVCWRAGRAGGLGRVHSDRRGGGIFFDCDWRGSLFFSREARTGEGFGRVSGFSPWRSLFFGCEGKFPSRRGGRAGPFETQGKQAPPLQIQKPSLE